MLVRCEGCGAELRLNPNLKGTQVSCPQCGARMMVPEEPPEPPEPRPRLQMEEEPAPGPPPRSPPPREAPSRKKLEPPARVTFWLLAAQTAIGLLGVSCLAGALVPGWEPPASTYFREPPALLVVVGVGLLVAGWLAHYLPVLATLGVAVFVLCATAHRYVVAHDVDASRTLALSAAMLALWLALQHRRSCA
jgi:DNA-directed RNA polymerase subunit RPC12/RpoP